MKSEISGSKALSFFKIEVSPGESLTIDRAGLFAFDEGLRVKWKWIDGLFGSCVYLLSGRGLPFCHEIHNPMNVMGSILVSFPRLGQIRAQKIIPGEQGLIISINSYFGGTLGLTKRYKWLGFRSWLQEGSLFFVHVYGHGIAWYGAYGDFYMRKTGKSLSVETNYLLAYQPHLKIRAVPKLQGKEAHKGNDRQMVDILGEGVCVLQTRDMDRLSSETKEG